MRDTPIITREIVGAARKFLGVSAKRLAREASVSARALRATMREDPSARWLDYAELGELRLAFFNVDVDYWGPEALTKGEEWSYARAGDLHVWASPNGDVIEVRGEQGHPRRLMGVVGVRPSGDLYAVLGVAGVAHLRSLEGLQPWSARW